MQKEKAEHHLKTILETLENFPYQDDFDIEFMQNTISKLINMVIFYSKKLESNFNIESKRLHELKKNFLSVSSKIQNVKNELKLTEQDIKNVNEIKKKLEDVYEYYQKLSNTIINIDINKILEIYDLIQPFCDTIKNFDKDIDAKYRECQECINKLKNMIKEYQENKEKFLQKIKEAQEDGI